MRKERDLAVRTDKGDVALYHDSNYPSPAVIDIFEKYSPGSSGVILEMVRKDQENGFVIENRNSLLEFWTRILGMVFAFILTLAMIGVGALLIIKGNPITGCLTLFTGIIGIITVIATGGKEQGGGVKRK